MKTNLFIVFVFMTIGLWFWAMFDISKTRFKSQTLNSFWLLTVLFFPVIGPAIYLLLKKCTTRPRRKFSPNFRRE